MARLQTSLRGLLACAVAVAAMSALAASASAAPLVWSINKDKDSVATIDSGSGKIVGTSISVGERPESIAMTPDGRRALVTNNSSNSVSVIDIATRSAIASIPLPGPPGQVAISPDGKTAYVTVEGSKEVSVVNTGTAQVVGTVSVGGAALAVAFAPDGRHAYVSSGEESVDVVDTQTGSVVGAPLKVGKFPQSIVFTPNGRTAYVSSGASENVTVIDTGLGVPDGTIPVAGEPKGLAVGPSGGRLYVADESDGAVLVYETDGNRQVGKPIETGTETQYVAITPDGRTAYVAAAGGERVTPINLATNQARTPIIFTGEAADLVAAPDQSPTAVFAPPAVTEGVPATFTGTASTDPDGTVSAWDWTFGDAAVATGPVVEHTYAGPGTYDASLAVTDNEGCGEEEVFTGRTSYCSGNPLARVVHPVEARVAPLTCKAFRFGAIVHNRRNGTVRVQVRLPAAGSLFLFGKKIHAVTRKSVKAGSAFLTLHARVRINKRLKKVHHTRVQYRLTFYPAAGCSPSTRHGSVALLRAPRKKHRHR